MQRGRKPKCPTCGAVGQSISKGVRKTATMGLRKLRVCKACGHKFTVGRKVGAEASQIAANRVSSETVEAVASVPAVAQAAGV